MSTIKHYVDCLSSSTMVVLLQVPRLRKAVDHPPHGRFP